MAIIVHELWFFCWISGDIFFRFVRICGDIFYNVCGDILIDIRILFP